MKILNQQSLHRVLTQTMLAECNNVNVVILSINFATLCFNMNHRTLKGSINI